MMTDVFLFLPFLGLWITALSTMQDSPPLQPFRKPHLSHILSHPHRNTHSPSLPFHPSIHLKQNILKPSEAFRQPSPPLWPKFTSRYSPPDISSPTLPLQLLHWLALVACACLLPTLFSQIPGAVAGETWGVVSACPFHCICRNLSESLSTLVPIKVFFLSRQTLTAELLSFALPITSFEKWVELTLTT